MAKTKTPSVSVNAPAPRISGVGSRTDAARIADAVAQGVGDGLMGLDHGRGGQLDLGNLKLRLPHGAHSREVARAIERAVREALRGRLG
jgi:hypothetical protein